MLLGSQQISSFAHEVSELQLKGTSVQKDIFNVNIYGMLFFFYYFTSCTKGL